MSSEESSGLTPAMKVAIGVIGAVVIAGIVIAAIWNNVGNDADQPGAASPTAAETGKGRAPGADPTPTTGPSPDATPTSGSEVLPPSSAPSTGLPAVPAVKPLIQAPLPKSDARTGDLVTGFPVKIAGPVKGATVLSSAIAGENSVMQVDLVAVTATSPEKLRAHYRDLWSSLGLQERTSTDGTVTFIGPYESLTLVIGSSGTGNRYTIHGVFRTE